MKLFSKHGRTVSPDPEGTMEDVPKECVITDEDLLAALKEIGLYIDVTLGDLKRIYSLALKNAEERKRASGERA